MHMQVEYLIKTNTNMVTHIETIMVIAIVTINRATTTTATALIISGVFDRMSVPLSSGNGLGMVILLPVEMNNSTNVQNSR